ncbi:MAG: transferase [Candidatus Cloacimonadota bacterium]|nr:MAG: transferase [Candidatus Cloacimonadota bacterium]
MKPEYQKLEAFVDAKNVFDVFFKNFEKDLYDKSICNDELVCETLYHLDMAKNSYKKDLEMAKSQSDMAMMLKLLSYDPRQSAQEPEYYGDLDQEKYKKNKPIHWLWAFFDKLPISRNTLFAFPFRRIMGKFMFKHLGDNVKLFHNIEFSYGYNLVIEDNVVIHREVLLDDRAGIIIKKNASVSDFVNIYSHHHDTNDIMKISLNPTTIGEGARVTYHSTVLAGQSLGDHAVLGAMSLATKPLNDLEVKGGLPAKKIAMVQRKNFKVQD